jgi:hypothetical protein
MNLLREGLSIDIISKCSGLTRTFKPEPKKIAHELHELGREIGLAQMSHGDSRPTHPASSIFTMDEVPLSRGDFQKAYSAWCSIRSTET